MTILFQSDGGPQQARRWREELHKRLPDEQVAIYPDIADPSAVEFAICWKPPPGLLAGLGNLRAVFSTGAGVDHLFADPHLPAGLPVVRVVDDDLTERMVTYVVGAVLHYHQRLHDYALRQRAGQWAPRDHPAAFERKVGLLGLGALGGAAARALVALGFDVAGWRRGSGALAGVRVFHGREALAAFLRRSEILVCLLPLTAETADIMNANLFAQLPSGACLINAARGHHLVEEDLLAALASGSIAHATLDVFREEPLPANHPFWAHPGITITPHVASISDPRSIADRIAANIARARAGKPLQGLVDPVRGY